MAYSVALKPPLPGSLAAFRSGAEAESLMVQAQRPFLSLNNVSRFYGPIAALRDFKLDVSPNEFVSLLGPSGSGKSTALNLIAGFDFVDSGSVFLDGRDVTWEPSYLRGVGMVFQNYALFPHLNVFENVAFPLRARREHKTEVEKKVRRALELVQLASMQKRLPRQLSGGQQQRVALARAIVYGPKILLMDEPLGALDRKLRTDMQLELKRIHKELGTTFLYVTHDQEEALSMSDRIAVLNKGCLEQFASPQEVYCNPASKFVASFVGETNFLQGQIDRKEQVVYLEEIGIRLRSSRAAAVSSSQVTVSVRPEIVGLSPALPSDAHAAVVEETLYLGKSIKCIVRALGKALTADVPATQNVIPQSGDRVAINIDGEACSFFSEVTPGSDFAESEIQGQ